MRRCLFRGPAFSSLCEEPIASEGEDSRASPDRGDGGVELIVGSGDAQGLLAAVGRVVGHQMTAEQRMGADEDFMETLTRLADAVAAKLDCDVLVFSGPMRGNNDDRVIDLCHERIRRPNVMLVLSTYGGDARVAYRIARRLQADYDRLIVFVYGFCKSAGTLLALGANEVVLSNYAELGPLDVQVRKTDEVGEVSSGLTPMQALDTLSTQAFQLFEQQFSKLRNDLEMTTKLAAEIASKMTVGLLGHVYGQIDPMRLGELSREIRVASEYGQRLVGQDRKKKAALARLITGYPTHGFVIDRGEASALFDGVREPSVEEEALAKQILNFARYPAPNDSPIIDFVGTELKPVPKPAEAASERRSSGDGSGDGTAAVAPNVGDHGAGESGGTAKPGSSDGHDTGTSPTGN